MGAFADAHFRVFGNTEESRKTMRAMLAPLRAHVREAGLGFISEMFDGDPPHTPRGCFAQAWSVGGDREGGVYALERRGMKKVER